MTNKEAIKILGLECDEWDVSHCTASERREAFDMAIDALEELDNNSNNSKNSINNSNDEVNNSTNNSNNSIKNRVKGMTACRVQGVDTVCRKKVEYKLTALVNEIEEIFSDIRERNEDDSVCGLCEYDGAYIGQSGEWCNECPGFDKADCFKLKDEYRKEWLDIDG